MKPKRRPQKSKLIRSLQHEAQNAVGQAVWLCRRKTGISQKELAEAASLDVKTLYHMEKGTRSATIASLATVSAVLGVSMQELVPGYLLGGLHEAE